MPLSAADGLGFVTAEHPALSDGPAFATAKEETWDIRVVVDSAGHGRCTRQFARSVRKSAKSRLNPETIVRYTARIVIQSARTKAVNCSRAIQ